MQEEDGVAVADKPAVTGGIELVEGGKTKVFGPPVTVSVTEGIEYDIADIILQINALLTGCEYNVHIGPDKVGMLRGQLTVRRNRQMVGFAFLPHEVKNPAIGAIIDIIRMHTDIFKT